MLAAPEATVRRVAAFIGVEATGERLATALDQSSLASMRANHDKYDDLMMRALSERNCDLPTGGASGKVGTGGSGNHRGELSEVFLAELDAAWRETLGADYGLDSYQALLAALPVL